MRSIEIRAPFDGSLLAEEPLASEAEADALLRVQLDRTREAPLPAAKRIEILQRSAQEVRARAEGLALLIAREGGKPLVDARVEVTRAASGLDYLAGEVARLSGEAVPMGATPATDGRVALTVLEPLGLLIAISAFNHPLNLIVHQVGPAVAAGCPAIVKPALETPLSCRALIEILERSGLPAGHVAMLLCDNAVSERVASRPGVSLLSFIGSATVGWHLRSVAAPGTKVTLEHGGAAPLIVDASADLGLATQAITKGGYYHAGQVCVSTQRVYVLQERYAELRDRLAASVGALVVGDPTSERTEVGPLIRAREVERVHGWVNAARSAGAGVVVGGRVLDHQCYAPTLVDAPPDDSPLVREEVFGPVVSLLPVADLAEAVARANQSRWLFQAAVFTASQKAAFEVARGLSATAVMINDHTAFRADWMPFGGQRESGLGVGGLRHAVRDLCREKLLVIRLS